MFYSQVVLSKKGPLGKVWLAAHHEKRLSRPQIFAFDISQTAYDIAHPQVPLALRLSGHLLLGVVRIYSRKVNYLMEDAHEASVKIDTTFAVVGPGGGEQGDGIQLPGGAGRASRGGAGGGGQGGASDRLDLANFGDLHQAAFSLGGGFEIPTDMIPELEDWDVAAGPDDYEGLDGERGGQLLDSSGRRRSPRDDDDGRGPGGGPARKRPRLDGEEAADDSVENMALSLDTTGDRFSPGDGGAGARSSSRNRRSGGGDDLLDEEADPTLMDRRNRQLTGMGMAGLPDQEDWDEFKPGEEDDDDDEGGRAARRDTSMLEIEATRAAADASNTSDLQLRSASGLLKDDSDLEFPQPDQDDDEDFNNVHPFDDDQDHRGPRPSLALALASDEAEVMGSIGRASGLGGEESADSRIRLDDDDTDEDDAEKRKNAVGGLDTSEDEEDAEGFEVGPAELADEPGASKKKGGRRGGGGEGGGPADPAKRRRARRIVMDVGSTRLTSDEIRQNLADASDLEVAQVHPATWIPGVDPSQQPAVLRSRTVEERMREVMPRDVYLARPSCADDGTMDPELLRFWMRHTAPVLGKELPYELVTKAERAPEDGGKMGPGGDEDADEAEVARGGQPDDEEMFEPPKLRDDQETEFPPPDDQETEFPPPDDDEEVGGVHPFDDEGDVPPPPRDGEMEEPGGDDDALPKLDDTGDRSRLSGLSLGLVNEFEGEGGDEEDDDEDPRQDQGDTLASSSSKWHKHTVKVFDMLHRNMPPREPRVLSFDGMCDARAVTRRTACGVFFELLQLKTWDIIELDQDEFFGDMKISPGVKFNEKPPAANRDAAQSPAPAI